MYLINQIILSFDSIMNSTKTLLSGPQFLVFVMYVVLAIRSVEQSLQSISFEFVVCIYCLLLQLLLTYLSCHFATNITIKLTDPANIIYNTRWYALPVQQQKMIVSIICQGQIRNKLSGYIFSTSLETLMNVGKII